MIGPSVFQNFISSVSSGSSLIPQRSVVNAVRLAMDESRDHPVPAPVRIPLAAWSQMTANLRSMLHEPLARLVGGPRVAVQGVAADPLGLRRFSEEKGLGSVDLYFRTHPLMENVLLSWKRGHPSDALQAVLQKRQRIKSYLTQPLLAVLDAMEKEMGIELPAEAVREMVRAYPAVSEGGRRFEPGLFVGLNSRGIDGYNRQLFGHDPLARNGFYVLPEERPIDRLIDLLPQGAIVADWGAGAGIFAAELKETRKDLRLYMVDQYGPEEVMPVILPGQNGALLIEEVLRSAVSLTGDALQINLPDGIRADCLLSVALSPYVPDPLGLLAHMYNQLAPGGLLVTTFTDFLHDATLPWQQNQQVVFSVVSELRRQGVTVGFFRGHKVLALRRPDERKMKRSAELVGSFYEPFEMNLGNRRIELEHCLSFYRPAGASHQWIELG